MNQFITQNLTEEEIDVVLIALVEVKRKRFGRVEVSITDGKIVDLKQVFAENPATFRTIYSGH